MRWRVAAALLMIVSGGLCGRSFAAASNRRSCVLDKAICALKLLKTQMGEIGETVECALGRSESEVFFMTGREMEKMLGAQVAWETVKARECCRGGRLDCLRETEIGALDMFFEDLGRTGRSEQIKMIEVCSERLKYAAEDAKRISVQNARLYPAMGLLTGLAAAVLMI